MSLLPMMIMMGAAAANADKLKGLIQQVTTVAVQSEVNEISKMIVLDNITGSTLPKAEEFEAYLRANMRVPASNSAHKRDVSKDRWQHTYRVEYPGPNQVKVSSAGPDGVFDTPDDIYSVREL